MSRLAIADTGLLVAYLDPDDAHHDWAVEQFERFPFFGACEAVVAEACHLTARAFGNPIRVLRLLSVGAVRITYSLRGEDIHIERLMTKYADRPMDFADACLIRMTEHREDCEVITVDSDFHVYRRHGDRAIPVSMP